MKQLILASFFLCLFFSSALANSHAAPTVVVSIKPLHSLVSSVMQGVGQPLLLVKGGGSPHGYVLRPSEAKSLAKAQLVVWVGHELESFLEKPLATLGRNALQLELAEQLEDHLLVKRQGDNWGKSAHVHGDHDGEHHDDHGHQEEHHQNTDLHLWLDPILAQQIAQLTSDSLSKIDPAHRSQYQANAAELIKKLDQLHQKLSAQLSPVKDTPYIVFHAAYQYFEKTYGLNASGSITIDPTRKPGAKKVKEIRHKIEHLGAKCVFSEPQFESRLVSTVIEGTGAKTGVLDPLGSNLTAGPEAYFQLMTNLGDNLYEGLK